MFEISHWINFGLYKIFLLDLMLNNIIFFFQLEQDFNCYIKQLEASKEIIPPALVSKYPTLFCDVWPQIANKIVAKFNTTKCKNVDINNFLAKHKDFIGVRNDILALFIISFSPGVNKTVTIKKKTKF